jgi:hypothetical protein
MGYSSFARSLICAGFAIVAILPHFPAFACIGFTGGPMPICGELPIVPGTDVVVINAPRLESRTNILFEVASPPHRPLSSGPEQRSASYIKIVIADPPNPLTLVVSHRDPAVVHATGNVDRVRQLIAMGSTSSGWEQVAVAGIPEDRITFIPVIDRDQSLYTNCGRPPDSCVPFQYFEPATIDRRHHRAYPLDPENDRIFAALHLFVEGLFPVHIPPRSYGHGGAAEAPLAGQGWHDQLAWNHASAGSRALFEKTDLVTPGIIFVDPDLPSWEGIEALIQSGQLREPGSYSEDPDLRRFSKMFGARFSSRHDPEFRFEPAIDFVLTPSYLGGIPRDLEHNRGRPLIFLAPSEFASPKPPGDQGEYCFFYTDRYLFQRSSNVARSHRDQMLWQLQCRSVGGHRTYPNNLLSRATLATRQLQVAEALDPHTPLLRGTCRPFDIPSEPEVIVLSTAMGRTEKGLTHTTCRNGRRVPSRMFVEPRLPAREHTQACQFGQVDVEISRPGPSYILLKTHSATEWNFSLSGEAHIIGVMAISQDEQVLTGLPVGTPFHRLNPHSRHLKDAGCGRTIDTHPLIGGPAVLLFDWMLEHISGRRMDMLYNKGLPPEDETLTEAQIRDYSQFVVE